MVSLYILVDRMIHIYMYICTYRLRLTVVFVAISFRFYIQLTTYCCFCWPLVSDFVHTAYDLLLFLLAISFRFCTFSLRLTVVFVATSFRFCAHSLRLTVAFVATSFRFCAHNLRLTVAFVATIVSDFVHTPYDLLLFLLAMSFRFCAYSLRLTVVFAGNEFQFLCTQLTT